MYPSPITAEVGNCDGELTAPFMTMVPGFTPPIVEPCGSVTVFPLELIAASPT